MSRTLTARLAAATVALSFLAVGGGSAHADESTDAPVTKNDQARLMQWSETVVDVLENDSDPNGDQLEICRVEVPENAPIEVADGYYRSGEDEPVVVEGRQAFDDHEVLVMFAYEAVNRAYTIKYWACDKDYLTPATVTVHIFAQPDVKVHRIGDRPGFLKVVNPSGRRVVVLYGSFDNRRPDGRVAVAPHRAARIRVHRHVIDWVAYGRNSPAGVGHVRGIRLPKGDPGLPTSSGHDSDSGSGGGTAASRWRNAR